ncbi:hypothetical protein [Verrucomicrobium spinosum]|nr:hypothetical protein [Verrucomicrobium spinosum]
MLSHTELALNGDFKSSVLQELQKNSKDLDLRVPVREYISCLILIHGKVRELISGVVNDARTKYNAAIEQFTIMNGELVEFAWFQICNEMGERLEKFDLVSEFLTLYDKLYKRNSGVHDLRRKYASGATHKPLWV